MKNAYHRDIMEILLHEGAEGLNLQQIARRVYNRHAGLFATDVVYADIYRSIRFYLWAQARRTTSPFIHTGRRGQYAIKPHIGIQMDICFDAPTEPDEDAPAVAPDVDYPTLF